MKDWRAEIEKDERRSWILEPLLFWIPYAAGIIAMIVVLNLLRGHGPAWAWMLFGLVMAICQGAVKLLAKRK